MSNTIAASLIRNLPPLKVPINEVEESTIRKHCARIGSRIAPFMRAATLEKIERDRDGGNRSFPARKSEWPRHGHVQRLPSRASLAKGGMRKNL
jgi:hypothetical protein